MQVNIEKLNDVMTDKSISAAALASSLGIDRSTFYRKLNRRGQTFSIGEVHRIVTCLDLSKQEAADIFLSV